MTNEHSSNRWNNLVAGLCAGLAAGVAMNLFARAASVLTSGREGHRAAPGGDRTGRGVQPPQAEGSSSRDAAVKAGSLLYRAAVGHQPPKRQERALGVGAHYALSGGLGVAYAALLPRLPWLGAGRGALYGAGVWVVADEGITPALGLSRGPGRLGPGVLLYGLAGHLVYGVALDCTRRLLMRRPPRLIW